MPAHLLAFSVQTAVTTLTCVVEALSWDAPREDKIALMQLYVPYLALGMYFCSAELALIFSRLHGSRYDV